MGDLSEWISVIGTLPDVVGPKDLPKLNEGLRYLLKELREAQAEFVAGNPADGTYLSLVAVYAFVSLFRSVSIEGLALPLDALESALWALDEGIVEPVLRPARRAGPGRQRAPNLRQQLKGAAVWTVHRLRGLGYSLPDAHSAVAADLERVGVKPDRGSGKMSARVVRGWCEDVAEDVGRHQAAAQRFQALTTNPRSAVFDRMPREAAVMVLRARLRYAALAVGESRRRPAQRAPAEKPA
jgi:hypothetical protein